MTRKWPPGSGQGFWRDLFRTGLSQRAFMSCDFEIMQACLAVRLHSHLKNKKYCSRSFFADIFRHGSSTVRLGGILAKRSNSPPFAGDWTYCSGLQSPCMRCRRTIYGGGQQCGQHSDHLPCSHGAASQPCAKAGPSHRWLGRQPWNPCRPHDPGRGKDTADNRRQPRRNPLASWRGILGAREFCLRAPLVETGHCCPVHNFGGGLLLQIINNVKVVKYVVLNCNNLINNLKNSEILAFIT